MSASVAWMLIARVVVLRSVKLAVRELQKP
jgi:hypothetical protein